MFYLFEFSVTPVRNPPVEDNRSRNCFGFRIPVTCLRRHRLHGYKFTPGKTKVLQILYRKARFTLWCSTNFFIIFQSLFRNLTFFDFCNLNNFNILPEFSLKVNVEIVHFLNFAYFSKLFCKDFLKLSYT